MQGALSLVVLLFLVQVTSAKTWEASREQNAYGAQSSTASLALRIRLRVPWYWRVAQVGTTNVTTGHERGEGFKAEGHLDDWWKRMGWSQERLLATRAASRTLRSGCSSEAEEDGPDGSEEQQKVST